MRRTGAALAFGAALVLAGCAATPAAVPTTHSAARFAAGLATYQLHMTFFSVESKISPVIDPQVFIASPGATAGVGPQGIAHKAGLAPPRQTGDRAAPLFGADGTPLKITLAQWERAAGHVRLSCDAGNEKAMSTLTGLIPSATYSLFVVHLKKSGAARFTPWGNAAGTDNSFSADASGKASPTDSVPGCLGSDAAAVVIWHSDGVTHGASPGTIGTTWHNSLITPLP